MRLASRRFVERANSGEGCSDARQGTGTLTLRFEGTGSGGAFTGQYRIVGSSGGLAGTHGLGQFSVAASGLGTYSGSQHYEP